MYANDSEGVGGTAHCIKQPTGPTEEGATKQRGSRVSFRARGAQRETNLLAKWDAVFQTFTWIALTSPRPPDDDTGAIQSR